MCNAYSFRILDNTCNTWPGGPLMWAKLQNFLWNIFGGQDIVVGVVTRLWAGRSGVRIREGARSAVVPTTHLQLLQGFFTGGKSARALCWLEMCIFLLALQLCEFRPHQLFHANLSVAILLHFRILIFRRFAVTSFYLLNLGLPILITAVGFQSVFCFSVAAVNPFLRYTKPSYCLLRCNELQSNL
jgi:hypothetical protein